MTESHRCTYKRRERSGNEVECSDVGMWAYDKTAKTWRPVKPTDKARRCWRHGPGSETTPIGPRRRRTKPNAKLQRVAGLLLGVSTEVTKALEDVHAELSTLGFPGSSSNGANFLATDMDPVAGDAVRIAELGSWREDMRDAITDLEQRTDALIRLVKRVRNINWAHGVKLCAEGQQGRQGSIEWGDPTCTELPVRSDLCRNCYDRERLWRVKHDVPGNEEPAA